MSEGKRDLLALSPELWILICSQLDLHSLCALSEVSREYRLRLSSDDYLFEQLYKPTVRHCLYTSAKSRALQYDLCSTSSTQHIKLTRQVLWSSFAERFTEAPFWTAAERRLWGEQAVLIAQIERQQIKADTALLAAGLCAQGRSKELQEEWLDQFDSEHDWCKVGSLSYTWLFRLAIWQD